MNRKWIVIWLAVFSAVFCSERLAAGSLAMQVGAGVLSATNGADSPYLSCGASVAIDVYSTSALSLALDTEVWAAFGSYQEGYLQTIPVLLGMRAAFFPSSPLRLYAAGGAGVCITKYTVTRLVYVFPFFFTEETVEEETSSPLACMIGGGAQLSLGGNYIGLDYRFLIVPDDPRLSGHLISVGYGFRF